MGIAMHAGALRPEASPPSARLARQHPRTGRRDPTGRSRVSRRRAASCRAVRPGALGRGQARRGESREPGGASAGRRTCPDDTPRVRHGAGNCYLDPSGGWGRCGTNRDRPCAAPGEGQQVARSAHPRYLPQRSCGQTGEPRHRLWRLDEGDPSCSPPEQNRVALRAGVLERRASCKSC